MAAFVQSTPEAAHCMARQVNTENIEMEEATAAEDAVARDIAQWFTNMDAAMQQRKEEEDRDRAHREANEAGFTVSHMAKLRCDALDRHRVQEAVLWGVP
jgi:hypothetical protein